MAKLTKFVEVPAKTVEHFSHYVCDLCGKNSPGRNDWANDSYDVDEVTIEHKTGSAYPESGGGTYTKVDLCPECFNTKLVPWLRGQGAAVREENWDY